jgi:hypothetical protein
MAQVYTKYQPLTVRQNLLVDLSDLLIDKNIIRAFARTNDELIRYLAMRPEVMHELEPRQFEELVNSTTYPSRVNSSAIRIGQEMAGRISMP